MEQNPSHNSPQVSAVAPIQKDAEGFSSVPQASEPFGTFPNDSERFRNLPHISEALGRLPQVAERKETHTLSVREVSRLFEAAGVARTERSITNWCRKNAQGEARLDAYFDPNEGKYFITPESVELAIIEEKAKAAKNHSASEPFRNVPKVSEYSGKTFEDFKPTENNGSFQTRINDLEIASRVKDKVIEHYEKQEKAFVLERQGYIEQLITSHRRLGELETENKLLRLAEPSENRIRKLEVRGDSVTD